MKDKHLSIVINGLTFTLEDLGPAADLRIDKAMQSILDQGLLGEEFKGLPWYRIFETQVDSISVPEEDDLLCHNLFRKYEDYLQECAEAQEGKITQEQRLHLRELRDKWIMAEKLRRA